MLELCGIEDAVAPPHVPDGRRKRATFSKRRHSTIPVAFFGLVLASAESGSRAGDLRVDRVVLPAAATYVRVRAVGLDGLHACGMKTPGQPGGVAAGGLHAAVKLSVAASHPSSAR